MTIKIKSNVWILLGFITYICSLLFSRFPSFAEDFYFKGVFQFIRVCYDYILGWLPIPMFYIVLAITILIIARLLKKAGSNFKSKNLKEALLTNGLGFLNFASAFYFLFYWLWGFNYQKPNFETTLNLEVVRISSEKLFSELEDCSGKLALLRMDMLAEADTIADFHPKNLEHNIRVQMTEFLTTHDFPNNGRVRIRKLRPKGFLLRISTAGVYIPFACEGHIDAGLHPLTWPATMAHEMAHGYGFTDEGTCNFIGFQVCIDSDDKYMQYSGWLMYFRYLYSNARRADPEKFKLFRKGLDPKVYADLVEIDSYAKRYPDIMPKVRDAVYDQYLKTHGIKEGLQSYSRMILLVDAWKRKYR